MSRRLPDRIDPWSIAQGEEHFEGIVDVSEMGRLSAELLDDHGDVQVEIRGVGRDGGWCVLEGNATAELKMVCQRCLGPVSIAVRAAFRLGLIEEDRDAEALPEELEPVVVRPHETCRLAGLVEDELLLALPIVPVHESVGMCGENDFTTVGESDERRAFSDLGELWARAKEQE